jgi:hypothetical protein
VVDRSSALRCASMRVSSVMVIILKRRHPRAGGDP